MLNVIRFLESMGSEAQWDSITTDTMKLALENADVEDALRLAILDKDSARLQALLQQQPLIGYIELPCEEEEEEEDDGEDGDEEPGEKDARRSPTRPATATA